MSKLKIAVVSGPQLKDLVIACGTSKVEVTVPYTFQLYRWQHICVSIDLEEQILITAFKFAVSTHSHILNECRLLTYTVLVYCIKLLFRKYLHRDHTQVKLFFRESSWISNHVL